MPTHIQLSSLSPLRIQKNIFAITFLLVQRTYILSSMGVFLMVRRSFSFRIFKLKKKCQWKIINKKRLMQQQATHSTFNSITCDKPFLYGDHEMSTCFDLCLPHIFLRTHSLSQINPDAKLKSSVLLVHISLALIFHVTHVNWCHWMNMDRVSLFKACVSILILTEIF